MEDIANVRVGKPQTTPSKPSHVPGVHEGNWPSRRDRREGIVSEGMAGRGTARRSTGINPEARDPIDPESPNLSPA